MVHCVAVGCTNNQKKTELNKEQNITFHRFPKKPDLRKLWINAVRRKDWQPSNCSYLCSKHFKESVIDRTSLCCVRLREGAVPEIFPTHPDHLKKVIKERRPLKRVAPELHISNTAPTKKKLKRDLSKCKTELKEVQTVQAELSDELQKTQDKLLSSENRVTGLEKKVKTLQQAKRRLNRRVVNLKEISVNFRPPSSGCWFTEN